MIGGLCATELVGKSYTVGEKPPSLPGGCVYRFSMTVGGLHGRVIFWIGAAGLAVFSTAALVVIWFTWFGISVPPGQMLADTCCTITLDWTAVLPFAVAAMVCFLGMWAGRVMDRRSRMGGEELEEDGVPF